MSSPATPHARFDPRDRGLPGEQSAPPDDPRAWGPLDRRLRLVLLLFALTLFGRDFTHSLGEFSDASHHLLNGIFVLDAARQPIEALSRPRAFAENYCRHFPAINIGYYPPVFPITEAAVMFFFGVSGAGGRLTVLLLALLMTLFAHHWFRLRLPPWWAAAATLLFITTPHLVYWGRDIMIDVPVLAWVVGAAWVFERLLRTDRPAWAWSLTLGALTTLAIGTKQHAVMLLPYFALSTIFSRRHALLLHPPIVVAALIMISAVGLLVVSQLALGGDAIGHSVGFTAQHVADRFNWSQWAFYPSRMPGVLGLPVLLAFLLGTALACGLRPPGISPLFVWIVVFYGIHAYMKAQDVRYALLWLPPFVALIFVGLHALSQAAVARFPGSPGRGIRLAAGAVVALLVGHNLVQASRVEVPRVPAAYLSASYDLVEELDGFSCLVFTPQWQARMPALFRVALEESRQPGESLYAFGRAVRADQLLRDWREHWTSIDALDDDLRRWNVRYVLHEDPSELNEAYGQHEVADAVRQLVARSNFELVRTYPVDLWEPRYPVRISEGTLPKRHLLLYRRVGEMELVPGAHPPLRPRRIPFSIPAAQGTGPTPP